MRCFFGLFCLTVALCSLRPLAAAEVATFRSHEKSVWRMAVTPDGKTLFTGSHSTDTMRQFDLTTMKLVREFHDVPGGFASIECSPDGKLLLTASWGSKVRLWDIATGEKLREVKQPVASPTCATFSPDGKQFTAVVKDHHVAYVYDTETGKELRRLTLPMEEPAKDSGGLSSACYSPDGKFLLAACGGKGHPKYTGEPSVIAIWNTETWKLHASFKADAHNIYRLAVSPDGKTIAAACHRSQYVKLWPMPEEGGKPAADPELEKAIAALIKDLDSDDFATREGADAKLRRIGPPARKALKKVVEEGEAEAQFRARAILKAIGKGEEADGSKKLPVKGLDVHSLAFSPDGKQLATGSSVKAVRCFTLWDLKTLKATPTPDKTGTWTVLFTPDGKRVVTGNSNGTVTVWDAAKLNGG